ncbi:metallophosphoesterase family protein [Paenibacillus nasutitermitis]|uniref:Exonuclease SbcCD subunit D n=1 Tax=Paenibacillus nasutitermitis TaxID=1652958 RepID=A0A917DNI0_9BACL|nr:DNA repair exonuclease [Paenibacillus nasutitermitis]GGD55983.1 exonuclease SbcCD subunit D [Paenibacillus nasutitermitis]
MSVPFRFIHAADLHVDSPFQGLPDAPAYVRDTLTDSTFQAVQRLVETAIMAEVDFVVIAGDLYDGADRSLRAQLALQKQWQQLHTHGVQLFVIHGNHDHLGGSRANLTLPETVTVFGSKQMEYAPAYRKDGGLAAYVYGRSYGDRAVTENIARSYRPLPDGPYHIALLHGNVDGNPAYDPYAPCSLPELASAGFDYWALGHIHTRAVLHRYPHVVYAGNTQGRHARETGAKGCYIVNVNAAKETELTFVPLDAVRFGQFEMSIEGIEHEQALLDSLELKLSGVLAENGNRPLVVRLRLTGRGTLHHKLTDAVFAAELLDGLRQRMEHTSERWQPGDPPWCWVTALETATGAALDLEAAAEEDSFAGELLRGVFAMETDGARRLDLMEESLAPLLANARMRKLVRTRMEEHSLDWLLQAKELAAGLLMEESEVASPAVAKGKSEGGDAT